MANRPISIEFVAEVADYLRDVKKVEVSTEDISDALVAVSRSGDDMERKLSAAMRDAVKDTEKLEKAVEGIPRATEKAADEAEKDFGRVGGSARDAAGDAAEAGREVGGEFRQNLGETLASGGGLGDIFADTLGGLASSMQGAAAGIFAPMAVAGLLAFNTIKGEWEKVQAEIAESAASMWSTVMGSVEGEIGRVATRLSRTVLIQDELARLWRDSPGDMRELVEQAELLGINANDVLLARAGDEEVIGRVNDALAHSVAETGNYLGMTGDVITAHDDIEKAIYKGETAWEQTEGTMDAYNASLPATAAAHALITQEINNWAAGVQKTQDEVAILNAAFQENPLDLTVRLQVDADQLRQYFPYGTVGSGSSGYTPRYED